MTVPCTAKMACPADNDCHYQLATEVFKLHCNYGYYGGDIHTKHAKSLAECAHKCSKSKGCFAATFVEQECHMKSNMTGRVYNPAAKSKLRERGGTGGAFEG